MRLLFGVISIPVGLVSYYGAAAVNRNRLRRGGADPSAADPRDRFPQIAFGRLLGKLELLLAPVLLGLGLGLAEAWELVPYNQTLTRPFQLFLLCLSGWSVVVGRYTVRQAPAFVRGAWAMEFEPEQLDRATHEEFVGRIGWWGNLLTGVGGILFLFALAL